MFLRILSRNLGLLLQICPHRQCACTKKSCNIVYRQHDAFSQARRLFSQMSNTWIPENGQEHTHQQKYEAKDHGSGEVALQQSSNGSKQIVDLYHGKSETSVLDTPSEILAHISRGDRAELLRLVEMKGEEMNRSHLLALLQIMCQETVQEQNTKDIRQSIVKQPGFQKLCVQLVKKGQFYSAESVYLTIKYLYHLGVPSSSLVMQFFLQLVKFHINNLTWDQMVELAFLLSRMEPTEKIEIIMQGIKTLLTESAWIHIKTLQVGNLANVIYLFGPDLKEKFLTRAVRLLYLSKDEMNLRDYMKTLAGLSKTDFIFHALEKYCLSEILKQCDQLDTETSNMLLEVQGEPFKDDLDWELLFQAVGDLYTSEQYDIWNKLYMLESFTTKSYFHWNLLEALSTDICLCPSVLDTFSADQWADMVKIYADSQTTWHKGQSDIILHVSRQGDNFTTILSTLPSGVLLDVLLSLLSLGYKSTPDQMDLLLTGKHITLLQESEDARATQNAYKLGLVLSAYEAIHPGYVKKSVKDCILSAVVTMARKQYSNTSGISHLLKQALGGDHFVVDSLVTRNGLVIDHLVWLRDQINPLPIPESSQIERKGGELIYNMTTPPTGVKSVVVLVPPGHCFHGNTGQLKGPLALHCKLLQENYMVVVINQEAFERMPDCEKLDYLYHKVTRVAQYQDLVMLGVDCLPVMAAKSVYRKPDTL